MLHLLFIVDEVFNLNVNPDDRKGITERVASLLRSAFTITIRSQPLHKIDGNRPDIYTCFCS
jgi:hypothetical protein